MRSVLVSITVALMLAVGTAEAKAPPPSDFALALVLSKHGGWRGPMLANNTPDFQIIDRILEARPRHVRLTPAPYGGNAVMHPRGEVAEQIRRLEAAGIKLGTAINAGKPMRGSPLAEAGYGLRPASEVIAHARAIRDASPGLYDFILLDFAVMWEEPRMQRIVTGIRALGFRVIVNAGGVNRDGRAVNRLPKGTWAFQKAVSFLGGPDYRRTARRVARGKQGVLSAYDRAYIRDIRRRRPASAAMLRFTVPEQVNFRFARLSKQTQRQLLTRLAKAQRRQRFRMTYPLFVPGMPESYRGGAPTYDSRVRGTFSIQQSLLARY